MTWHFARTPPGAIPRRMSQEVQNTSELSEINMKVLAEGESLPAVKLKDGSKVQTGTVATMLHNISLYNSGQREGVERELLLSVPTLIKVGLFDLFPPEDWIEGENPGRRLVGEEARRVLGLNG